MMYLLAIILPPLAVLLCGKPVQALLNLVLTVFFWVPGMVHAIMVVYNRDEDRRVRRIERAIHESGRKT